MAAEVLAQEQITLAIGSTPLDAEALQGTWTEAQYLKMTDSLRRLVEFTDGEIEVLPMPTRKHQVILALLYELFVTFIRPPGGKVLFAPLRMEVRPGKFREPDLLLLRNAKDPRNQDAFWLGADLVVEIVSPDNPERDTVTKRADYAEAGIPEYWIVDPEDETITVLTLADNRYVAHGVFRRGTAATSLLLDGFHVEVDAVFDAE
ncbi:MAG TPA: Uma2 family endonuclease [Roseiflexaceae bacterium]|nr:Uma2 family endonuclease [Roseiflexaceae bacterium]